MRTAQRPSFTGAALADAPHSATLETIAIAIVLIPFAPGFADAGASGVTRSRRAAHRIVVVMHGVAPHPPPRSRRDIGACGGDYMPGRPRKCKLGRKRISSWAAIIFRTR